MRLNAPKKITWLVAVILGILGLVCFLAPTLPLIAFVAKYAFWLVFAGFSLLALGAFLKGL